MVINTIFEQVKTERTEDAMSQIKNYEYMNPKEDEKTKHNDRVFPDMF